MVDEADGRERSVRMGSAVLTTLENIHVSHRFYFYFYFFGFNFCCCYSFAFDTLMMAAILAPTHA